MQTSMFQPHCWVHAAYFELILNTEKLKLSEIANTTGNSFLLTLLKTGQILPQNLMSGN